MKNRCEKEIIELHQFFQDWFSGAVPNTDEQFTRAADVLDEGFVIISPDGTLTEGAPLLAGIRQGHGTRPNFRIWVEDFRFHRQDNYIALTTYQEWAKIGEETTARISTALFREKAGNPNGVEWLHVHETWLAEAAQVNEFNP